MQNIYTIIYIYMILCICKTLYDFKKEKIMTQEELKQFKTQVHSLYSQCQKVMNPKHSLLNRNIELENTEEQSFYMMVSDFFLQQKQDELLRERELRNGRN